MIHPSKVDKFIYRAPIVYAKDSFYVLGMVLRFIISNNIKTLKPLKGGFTDVASGDKTIGRLDSKSTWSKAGELVSGRHSHNAIFDGSSIFVIGGYRKGLSSRA